MSFLGGVYPPQKDEEPKRKSLRERLIERLSDLEDTGFKIHPELAANLAIQESRQAVEEAIKKGGGKEEILALFQ